MRRWAFNAFCLLSLPVFIAGLAIWARGYLVPADVEWFSRYTDAARDRPLTRTLCFGVGWGPGTLAIFQYHGESSVPAETARTWIYREFDRTRTLNVAPAPDDRANLRLGTVQVLHRITTTGDGWLSLRILVVPVWLVLVFALPPLMWWRRRGSGWRSSIEATRARVTRSGVGGAPSPRTAR